MDQHVSTTRHCFPTSIQRRLNHQDRHWGDKAETREGMRHKQNGLAGLMHNRYSKDILPSSCLSRRAVLHGIVFQRQPPRITVTHTVEDIMRTATLIMGSSERIPTNEFALIDLQVLGTETPSIFADVEVAVSSAEEPTSLAAAYGAKKLTHQTVHLQVLQLTLKDDQFSFHYMGRKSDLVKHNDSNQSGSSNWRGCPWNRRGLSGVASLGGDCIWNSECRMGELVLPSELLDS